MPLSRATTVDGGMPIRVTSTEIAIAAGTIHAEGIRRPAAHQIAIVTAEAHVPEPGCKCPMPKNVAISQERRDLGAVVEDVIFPDESYLAFISSRVKRRLTLIWRKRSIKASTSFTRPAGSTN
jgi:hypothetical protein